MPLTVRRHAARVASRTLVLFTGDVLALLLAALLLRVLLGRQDVASLMSSDFTARGPLAGPGHPGSTVFWLAMIMALWITGSYSRQRGLNTSIRVATACALAAAAGAVPLAAIIGVPLALVQNLLVAVGSWVALLTVRLLSERFLRHVWPRLRGTATAILVGPPEISGSRLAAALAAPGGDYRVAATVEVPATGRRPVAETIDEIRSKADRERAAAVVLSDDMAPELISGAVEAALERGYQVLVQARALRLEGVRPRVVWHHDQPFLEIGPAVLKPSAVIAKRIADIFGATVVLGLSLPVMAVVAIWIKLDSPGPVFFAQDRAGLGGRRFRMLKFRTMRADADTEKSQLAHLNQTGDLRLFKIPGDPRVTRVGGFLRRWSLDELPQLWNVLVGQMSLVGPRPFFRSDFAAYEDHHFRRLDAKPGITGLWQVSGRSEIFDFEDVVYLDRQYIEQWSFWFDLSILFRTIPAVFRRTGAY